MATTRARQLEKLAMSMPAANQQAAMGAQEARLTQLKQQARQMPAAAGPAAAQQLGAQQAAQAGQIQLAAAGQTQQQQQMLGQMGLEERAREQRQQGFEQSIALNQRQRKIADDMARVDIKLKRQLLDDQLRFNKDQAGRTLFNERQLMDFAVAKAQSQEELAEYTQAAQQVFQREMQVLEIANAKITQALQQGQIARNKPLDRELRKKLVRQKVELEKQIQKKRNAAANKAAMYKAVGTVGAMVVAGGIIAATGGVGAPAAAAIIAGSGAAGGGVGSAAFGMGI